MCPNCESSSVIKRHPFYFRNILYSQLSDLEPISDFGSERLKASLVSSCYHYLHSKPGKIEGITSEHIQALKDLRNNNDVIVTKPGKGNGIVLLNKEDYVKKMEEHLKINQILHIHQRKR